MEPLPSRSALVRIGKALAAGTEADVQLDQLDVVLGRCDEVKAGAVERLGGALADVELTSGASLSVRGRTKTLITLREKLKRMGGHQLPVIRDLAGLRIVGDMTLAEQDEVLVIAAAALGIDQDDIKVIDRRAEPVQGYRALHGELVIEGVRVELQVRTLLQHEWAELYERAGDHFGRSIRYAPKSQPEVLPKPGESLTQALREASDLIATAEGIASDHISSHQRQRFAEWQRKIREMPEGQSRQESLRLAEEVAAEIAELHLLSGEVQQNLKQLLDVLGSRLGPQEAGVES